MSVESIGNQPTDNEGNENNKGFTSFWKEDFSQAQALNALRQQALNNLNLTLWTGSPEQEAEELRLKSKAEREAREAGQY